MGALIAVIGATENDPSTPIRRNSHPENEQAIILGAIAAGGVIGLKMGGPIGS